MQEVLEPYGALTPGGFQAAATAVEWKRELEWGEGFPQAFET